MIQNGLGTSQPTYHEDKDSQGNSNSTQRPGKALDLTVTALFRSTPCVGAGVIRLSGRDGE